MNKAFTKESDYDPDAELVVRPLPVLPAGVKNYITPAGAEAVRAELRELEEELRPTLLEQLSELAEAGLSEEKEHRMLQARRRQVDEHARHLRDRISSFEVVPPRSAAEGPIRFGDRVVAEDAEGNRRAFTIVGVDEADAAGGRISWISPMAKAFLGAEEGDEVTVHRPRGDLTLEILEIDRG